MPNEIFVVYNETSGRCDSAFLTLEDAEKRKNELEQEAINMNFSCEIYIDRCPFGLDE